MYYRLDGVDAWRPPGVPAGARYDPIAPDGVPVPGLPPHRSRGPPPVHPDAMPFHGDQQPPQGGHSFHVYCSPHNPGAAALLALADARKAIALIGDCCAVARAASRKATDPIGRVKARFGADTAAWPG
mgnify:CR=1 FL=1